ncbi:unnamed protein product, partial [marine sediment metagenome]
PHNAGAGGIRAYITLSDVPYYLLRKYVLDIARAARSAYVCERIVVGD